MDLYFLNNKFINFAKFFRNMKTGYKVADAMTINPISISADTSLI